MKKSLLTLVLCSFAFGLGFGVNNIAVSNNVVPKIAYVNVSKLVAASKTIKAADATKQKQEQEMIKWFNNANAEIQKQPTQAAKNSLAQKYETQLNAKKKAINDAYMKKVNEVDAQLDSAISAKAKGLGYTIVLRKDSVLFGGVDITSQIIPMVK